MSGGDVERIRMNEMGCDIYRWMMVGSGEFKE